MYLFIIIKKIHFFTKLLCYLLLIQRCVTVYRDDVRYKYTHEILNNGAPSIFNDRDIIRQRRISIIMRNEPPVNVVK